MEYEANIEKRFYDLFVPNKIGHGRTILLEGKNERGKQKSKSFWVDEPPTLEKVGDHLHGGEGIGFAMVRGDVTRFGVVDIDTYPLDFKKLNSDIVKLSLPLCVCRSKSGGAHCYLFFKEDVKAARVRKLLKTWATMLGHHDVEVFPKQDSVKEDAKGNWINAPYYSCMTSPIGRRHGFKLDGKALPRIEDWLKYAESRRTTLAEAEAVELPFEDAPPCLQRLVADGVEDNRNIAMFNFAVYVKQKYPDWKAKVGTLNEELCSIPLTEKEVENTLQSVEKKGYFYQCKELPCSALCNKELCKQREYGVGGGRYGLDELLVRIEADPEKFVEHFAGASITPFEKDKAEKLVKKLTGGNLRAIRASLDDNQKLDISNMLPMYSTGVKASKTAEVIYPLLQQHGEVFVRRGEGPVCYVAGSRLVDMTPTCFVQYVEQLGDFYKIVNDASKPTAVYPQDLGPILVHKLRHQLDPVDYVFNVPLLTEDGLITSGYHDGIIIKSDLVVKDVPFDEAVEKVKWLHREFIPVTAADRGRMYAAFLTPALALNNLLLDRSPVDFALATGSQSGKTFRHQLIQHLYTGTSMSVAVKKNGVGSLAESIGKVIREGHPFVGIDNARTLPESEWFESITTGQGHMEIRICGEQFMFDRSRLLFQMSSNGLKITKDMGNRVSITHIDGHADDFEFSEYPEGQLTDHILEHRGYYLSCVYSIVRQWMRDGRQKAPVQIRGYQKGWAGVLSWIVQEYFGCPPLLEGHSDLVRGMVNPFSQWIAQLKDAVFEQNSGRLWLKASKLLDIAKRAGMLWEGEEINEIEPLYTAFGRELKDLFDSNAGYTYVEVGGQKFQRKVDTHTKQKMYAFGAVQQDY